MREAEQNFRKGLYFFCERVYNIENRGRKGYRMKACMFTGHRGICARDVKSLPKWLDEQIESLIEQGYTDFCAGGAVGFDTFAALEIIEKKKKYGFVKLHLYLPCRAQDKGWSDSFKRAYRYIMSNADSVRYASETYTNWCMHKRNRDMVDASEVCIAYCNKSTGGTRYTLTYAAKKGKRIINFCDDKNNKKEA